MLLTALSSFQYYTKLLTLVNIDTCAPKSTYFLPLFGSSWNAIFLFFFSSNFQINKSIIMSQLSTDLCDLLIILNAFGIPTTIVSIQWIWLFCTWVVLQAPRHTYHWIWLSTCVDSIKSFQNVRESNYISHL